MSKKKFALGTVAMAKVPNAVPSSPPLNKSDLAHGPDPTPEPMAAVAVAEETQQLQEQQELAASVTEVLDAPTAPAPQAPKPRRPKSKRQPKQQPKKVAEPAVVEPHEPSDLERQLAEAQAQLAAMRAQQAPEPEPKAPRRSPLAALAEAQAKVIGRMRSFGPLRDGRQVGRAAAKKVIHWFVMIPTYLLTLAFAVVAFLDVLGLTLLESTAGLVFGIAAIIGGYALSSPGAVGVALLFVVMWLAFKPLRAMLGWLRSSSSAD